MSQKNDEQYDIFVNVLNKDYDWLAKDLKRVSDIGCVNEEEYQEQVYSDALTLGEVPQLPMHYVPRTSEVSADTIFVIIYAIICMLLNCKTWTKKV